MPQTTRYIPALSFRWLTPLYDPLLKWIMREETFKRQLIQEAKIQPAMKVLDVGCGTGTLTMMLKQSQPDALLIGIDGDSEVLGMAQAKSQGIHIQWDEGLATALPYSDSYFDKVVSSLVIHHLVTAEKLTAFKEM